MLLAQKNTELVVWGDSWLYEVSDQNIDNFTFVLLDTSRKHEREVPFCEWAEKLKFARVQ